MSQTTTAAQATAELMATWNMTDDRTLLERAAKAAGINVHRGSGWQSDMLFLPTVGDGTITGVQWNPLTDDGDALRLAVKLEIGFLYSEFVGEAEARWNRGADRLVEYGSDDPYAATRRAIVRAAAAMYKD